MGNYGKNQDAKFARFIFAAAICFTLLFAAMATSAVSAAPMAPADAEMTKAEIETVAPSEASAIPTTKEVAIEPIRADYGGADEANLEEKMREALTAVKAVIEVDDKLYPQFNYNYYPDGYGNDNWNFNWNSSDGNSSINATVLGNGRILYYGKYEYTEKNSANHVRFAEISKAEAAKKAEAFLKKLLGSEFEGYRLSYQSLGYPSDRYSLCYVLSESGYDYPDFQLYADVDKITGEVVSFSNFNYSRMSDTPEFDYQDASDVISQQEALQSYLENIGVELVYASYYDYEAKEHKIHPVYRLKNDYGRYISAVDGSVAELSDPYGISPLYYGRPEAESARAMMANDKAMGGEVYFSEAELSELAKAGDYITSDEALGIIAEAFDLELAHLEKFEIYASLQSEYMEKDKYQWTISLYSSSDGIYESYYATVDANDGTIINYSENTYSPYSYMKSPGDGVYGYEEALEIVTAKVKELCPVDLEANFELAEASYAENDVYYYFNFARKVNGILFESNGLYVNFDNVSGKISSYSFRWFDKAAFPKLENLVTPEKALESIAGHVGYDICYATDGVGEDGRIKAVLVYKFGGSAMADPYTGKCIGWNFEEMEPAEAAPNYKDLEGHWGESTVLTLADNGIYVWGGEKFDPDAAMTKGELASYLRFFAYNVYYFTRAESSIFVNQYAYRMMEAYSEDPDADKVITRQEAAKIVCEIAGYGELGQHTEIFRYPFNDENCDEEYRGYVAIIKAFGLIAGDDEGNYEGTKELTRAEAAAIIYNIVMHFSGK